MIQQTIVEDGAEKFVMIETTDGQFFLRAFKDAKFHVDAFSRFEMEAKGAQLKIKKVGGARIQVSEKEVCLHGFSTRYLYFPPHWTPLLTKLMNERYPGLEIRDQMLPPQ